MQKISLWVLLLLTTLTYACTQNPGFETIGRDTEGLREVFSTEVKPIFTINILLFQEILKSTTIRYDDPNYTQGFKNTYDLEKKDDYSLHFVGATSDSEIYKTMPYTIKAYGSQKIYSQNFVFGGKNDPLILAIDEPIYKLFIFITLPTGEKVYLRAPSIVNTYK